MRHFYLWNMVRICFCLSFSFKALSRYWHFRVNLSILLIWNFSFNEYSRISLWIRTNICVAFGDICSRVDFPFRRGNFFWIDCSSVKVYSADAFTSRYCSYLFQPVRLSEGLRKCDCSSIVDGYIVSSCTFLSSISVSASQESGRTLILIKAWKVH